MPLILHSSTNTFVFGNFNAHQVMWLHLPSVTGLANVELLTVQSFIETVDFPKRFPTNSDRHASLHDIFLTSYPNSCRALKLCPLETPITP